MFIVGPLSKSSKAVIETQSALLHTGSVDTRRATVPKMFGTYNLLAPLVEKVENTGTSAPAFASDSLIHSLKVDPSCMQVIQIHKRF